MKKIGIITINDYNNFGNRLQNYALQEIIRSLGFDVETIVYIPDKKNENKLLLKINTLRTITLKRACEFFLEYIFSKFNNIKNKNKIEVRIKAMKKFTFNYIKETNYSIWIDEFPEDLAERYDYFVVGSDQVWNPNFRKCSPIDFLTFAPKNKRVTYAPSFGVHRIPIEYRSKYIKWLSEINNLSVRENAGVDIIKDLTGKNAELLIDPTALISVDKWVSLFNKESKSIGKKFILTYFLGKINNYDKEKINKMAAKQDLKIINLGEQCTEDAYATDPVEFLRHIYSAEIILTDSFHGSLFSILFMKPFVVFERNGSTPSMNSRLDTLLSKFNLENRKWDKNSKMEDYLHIKYSDVGTILDTERDMALEYLRKALDVDELSL